MKKKPFDQQVIKLRVPIRKGEVEYGEITLKPPVLRDIVRTDGHDPDSVGYARALLSSLSGLPEALLDQIAPEDWADLRLILAQVNMRFMGIVNLLDAKEGDGDNDDPTTAAVAAEGTVPLTSESTSAA
ncbi:MAG: phage tail assembly protein [Treponema sp.]|jgi:hypothetical protein|nr:phage tail assembly protein [Treponema sp.]